MSRPATVRGRRRTAALALAIVAAVLAGCTSAGSSSGPDPQVRALAARARLADCPKPGRPASGSKLHGIALPCVGTNRSIPLGTRTGRPTVLALWGVWCGPCHAELPAVQRFATAATGKVDVVGVDLLEPSQNSSLEYLTDKHLHFANLFDAQAEVLHRIGLPGPPATILLRADGSVAAVHTGAVTDAILRELARQHVGVTVGG